MHNHQLLLTPLCLHMQGHELSLKVQQLTAARAEAVARAAAAEKAADDVKSQLKDAGRTISGLQESLAALKQETEMYIAEISEATLAYNETQARLQTADACTAFRTHKPFIVLIRMVV